MEIVAALLMLAATTVTPAISCRQSVGVETALKIENEKPPLHLQTNMNRRTEIVGSCATGRDKTCLLRRNG